MIEIIQQRVNKFLTQWDLINQPLVVAVSGGSDSICILHALKELNADITVAHLNHMIRGAEAERDAEFVEKFCSNNHIPCVIEHINVPEYKKQNSISSMEEAARIVRYCFLNKVAKSKKAVVITGHNQDDNVETILMHLMRGCGPTGLIGLNEFSEITTVDGLIKVARPLLTTPKSETEAYCKEVGIIPCFDSTNASFEYSRNRIRKELIPMMQTFNPNIQNAILRLSSLIKEENDFANSQINDLPYMLDILEDSVIITRRDFNNLQPYAQKVLLRLAIKALLGNVQDIENKHIEDMISLASGPSGKKINLSNGLTWSVEYMRLVLSFQNKELTTSEFDLDLNIPGETYIPSGVIKAEILDENKCAIENNPNYAYFDYDLLQELHVRTKHAGDLFIPFGSEAGKKVARFMLDAHYSQDERNNTYLVCNNDEIIWLVGKRASNLYKVNDVTSRILKLSFFA